MIGTNKPPDNPASLSEWLWYVLAYEENIFVREKNKEGKWDSVALSTLEPERWAYHVARWLGDGSLPARIREDHEINDDPNP
jgi:hypothetical protein